MESREGGRLNSRIGLTSFLRIDIHWGAAETKNTFPGARLPTFVCRRSHPGNSGECRIKDLGGSNIWFGQLYHPM